MKTHQPANSNNTTDTIPKTPQTIIPSKPTSIAQLQRALSNSNSPLTPANSMQLQKTIGNRAVAQLLKSRMHPTPPIQRVESPEEDELQMKRSDTVQRATDPEEGLIQQKPFQKNENNTGMPNHLKAGLENLSGMDLSDVRVHYNSNKPAQLQALAYAQGNNIHIGPGQEKHLPHEGWHVIQQRQGRVKPTMSVHAVPVNDNEGLEQEADIMGQQAVQRKVIYNGNFSVDNEVEVDEDIETYFQWSEWDNAQKALELYKKGDSNVNEIDKVLHSTFGEFESEPNLTLVITTDPNLEDFGQTTFSVWDGENFRGISEDAENPATASEWPAWMTDGNPIRMEVTINQRKSLAQIAHTLNHEISLHAASDLALIRKVREMRNPQMAKNFVDATAFKMGKFSGDYAHSLLGADKHPRLKATHLAMMAEAKKMEGSIDEQLDQDYASDVEEHKKFVPKPYVIPQQRKERGETGTSQLMSESRVTQFSKTREEAMKEMQLGLQEYNEEEDYWEDEEEEEEDSDPLFGQLTSMSCGIAAVQMVLATKGKYMDAQMIEVLSQKYPGSYNPGAGTSMDNMASILNDYVTVQGPKTMSLSSMLKTLTPGTPVIARVTGANGHFIVIDSFTGDEPEYDGARGVRKEGTRVLQIRDPWPPGEGSHIEVTEQEFQSGESGLKTTALYIHF